MKIFILILIVSFTSCKVPESTQLKSENKTRVQMEIEILKRKIAAAKQEKRQLENKLAVHNSQSTSNLAYALRDNGEYKSTDTYYVKQLEEKIRQIDISIKKYELAILQKEGKFTDEQYREAIEQLAAQRVIDAEQLDKTKKLWPNKCIAEYIIANRTSSQSSEEAHEGTYYSNPYQVLTCKWTVNNCNGDVFSPEWAMPSYRVKGAPYATPSEKTIKKGNAKSLNEAKALVGTPCPCSCDRVKKRY